VSSALEALYPSVIQAVYFKYPVIKPKINKSTFHIAFRLHENVGMQPYDLYFISNSETKI